MTGVPRGTLQRAHACALFPFDVRVSATHHGGEGRNPQFNASVRYEATTAGEDAFPHVYGPIPTSAVGAAEPLAPGMAAATALPPRIARLLAAARGNSPPGIDEWRHVSYTVSTDRARIDMDRVHGYLTRDAYWSTGIPPDVLEQALSNSLCFGVYAPDGAQAGFCRVITDRERFGWRSADPSRWMARGVAPSDIYG